MSGTFIVLCISIDVLYSFDRILKDGLQVGGTRGIDIGIGCASGVGIYLVEDAAGAVGYTRGANKIFGCRGSQFSLHVSYIRALIDNSITGQDDERRR